MATSLLVGVTIGGVTGGAGGGVTVDFLPQASPLKTPMVINEANRTFVKLFFIRGNFKAGIHDVYSFIFVKNGFILWRNITNI
jgi:hypothetical protein